MTPESKVDFKKSLDSYAARRGEFRLIDVPPRRYLMSDGHGDPNHSPDFTAAVQALYPIAYTLKFASKRELGRDYVVPPLEGLWWAADMDTFTHARDKSQWDWTLMLMIPDWLEESFIERARDSATAKRPEAHIDDVRVQTLSEGACVQTLHVGSFDTEAETVARLHEECIVTRGLRLSGLHHEIYLSDPRRTAPEKQRTIIRQPVAID